MVWRQLIDIYSPVDPKKDFAQLELRYKTRTQRKRARRFPLGRRTETAD